MDDVIRQLAQRFLGARVVGVNGFALPVKLGIVAGPEKIVSLAARPLCQTIPVELQAEFLRLGLRGLIIERAAQKQLAVRRHCLYLLAVGLCLVNASGGQFTAVAIHLLEIHWYSYFYVSLSAFLLRMHRSKV